MLWVLRCSQSQTTVNLNASRRQASWLAVFPLESKTIIRNSAQNSYSFLAPCKQVIVTKPTKTCTYLQC